MATRNVHALHRRSGNPSERSNAAGSSLDLIPLPSFGGKAIGPFARDRDRRQAPLRASAAPSAAHDAATAAIRNAVRDRALHLAGAPAATAPSSG